ncbi:hypothetical protein [Micromonospora sp. WMMC273]|uniref:hypothetical protein n=1 Tax=Micromonospora sp. WMMC273 TaxID=3015157 RepID=UPI0022B6F67E|nr:hypothetical protein [Micromonospora sp. WMMC273]MCZ7478881.1 hypothetical protein [Micromonospora sp. WMMC273]
MATASTSTTRRRAAADPDAPAPRRRRTTTAAAEEEAPAPRRRTTAAAKDAPAPRRRTTTAAAEDAPAPRRRRTPTAAADEDAPAPRRRRATTTAAEPAARSRRRTAPEPEESSTPDGEVDLETLTAEVPFRGRTVLVRMPTLEQLTIFRRLAQRFADLEGKEIDANKALDYYDRGLRVITAVVVKDEDKAWIEDMLLDGDMRLPDGLPLLHEATDALKAAAGDKTNRAGRRGAAKRASRR